MRKRVSASFAWLGAHYSAILSIMSMMIALTSLFYAVNAQRTDREYKELSIVPILELHTSTIDLSIRVKNVGLGPAILRDVATKLDNKCIHSAGLSQKDWKEEQTKFSVYVMRDIVAASLKGHVKGSDKPTLIDGNAQVPQHNQIIPAMGELTIFAFAADALRVINDGLNQMGESHKYEALSSFQQRAMDVPINFFYCSLSYRYCRIMTEKKLGCTFEGSTPLGGAPNE